MTARLTAAGIWLTAVASTIIAVCLVPNLAVLSDDLLHPYTWLARAGTDPAAAQLAGALLWLLASWVSLGLLTSYLSRLPGSAGRCFQAVARRITPIAVRRLVAASAGASLLLSPAIAIAEPAPSPGTAATSHPIMPMAPGWPMQQQAPAWPTDPPNASNHPATTAPSWPTDPPNASNHPATTAPSWPTDPPHPPNRAPAIAPTDPIRSAGPPTSPYRAASPADPPAEPTEPVPAEPTPAQPGPNPPTQAQPTVGTVTVRPGDSLWSIAGEHLGSSATDEQIVIDWPYWYRANRAVIGRDPAMIRAGARLRVPFTSAIVRPGGRS